MQNRQELYDKLTRERPDASEHEINKWIQYLQELKGCRLFSAVSQGVDEARWLQNRTAGIGGSDIASILGKNPWSSPRQIWMSKTGQFAAEGNNQSEAARWGNVLETSVAEEWAKRNNKSWVNLPVTVQSIEYPWMLANIDGFILDDDFKISGILEIKTTNEHNRDVWENGPLPYYYLCQANWYCYITGQDNFTLVCLVGGQKLYSYDLPLDTELVAEMIAKGKDFWYNNVQKLIEPKATDGDLDALKDKIEPIDPEAPALILADEESDRLAVAYVQLRDKISALEKIKKTLYAQLLDMMKGNAQALTTSHTLTISQSNRRGCDYDLLEARYPEAYAECIAYTTSSSLRIK